MEIYESRKKSCEIVPFVGRCSHCRCVRRSSRLFGTSVGKGAAGDAAPGAGRRFVDLGLYPVVENLGQTGLHVVENFRITGRQPPTDRIQVLLQPTVSILVESKCLGSQIYANSLFHGQYLSLINELYILYSSITPQI